MAETRKYQVELAKALWAYVTVEVDVDDLTEDEIYERAIELAHGRSPRICAQCAGWGRQNVSVSDDDEWQDIREWYGKEYNGERHGPGVVPVND